MDWYMIFNTNNKSTFIDCFQFLSFPVDTFVRILGKVYFKCSCQEFDSDLLDLVKQKRFYPFQNTSAGADTAFERS